MKVRPGRQTHTHFARRRHFAFTFTTTTKSSGKKEEPLIISFLGIHSWIFSCQSLISKTSSTTENTMDWSPDADTISQVLLMLQALRDPTCANHQQALQTLSTDTANPTFVLHLVHIFSRGGNYDGIPIDIRQLAGLITKNYIFPRLVELSEEVFTLVKQEIINGLADPVVTIRNTAALLVGRITAAFMSSYWVDIMETLLGGAIELPVDMTELQSDQTSTAARLDGSTPCREAYL